MMGRKCEIVFPEKEMAPYQKLNKLNDGLSLKDKCKKQIIDNGFFGKSKNKFKDILELTHDVADANEVLCQNTLNNIDESKISNDKLSEIPQLLNLVTNLQELCICNRKISSVPDTIGELQQLRILNLSNNQLQVLPDCLSNLKNLEQLDLSSNELTDLPKSYSKLQKLKKLDISKNHFVSLPKCVANGMGTLKVLNISDNPTVKVNIIPCSRYLEKFHAKNNQSCPRFPDWILIPKFFNLKLLDFDGTKFDVFSLVRKEGTLHLKTLSMSCSNLSSPVLEMMIENMICLEKINVGNEDPHSPGNVFNSIPINIFKNPAMITELNFRGTGLPIISSAIKKLCNLKTLDVGLNSITWFPDEFCELQELEHLIVDGNGLIMLPDNVGNLKSLKVFRAQKNGILKLPNSFKNLNKLEIVDLYDNIFEEFPNILTEMKNLQGLDLEQNFCSTDNIKIRGIPYSNLQETLISSVGCDGRICGLKYKIQNNVDDYDDFPDHMCSGSYSDTDEDEDHKKAGEERCDTNNVDENWDSKLSSDDEFEPINYNATKHIYSTGQYKHFIPQDIDVFCPADLHSQRIKADVASMRAYGSVPSFKIEQGQFDDA